MPRATPIAADCGCPLPATLRAIYVSDLAEKVGQAQAAIVAKDLPQHLRVRPVRPKPIRSVGRLLGAVVHGWRRGTHAACRERVIDGGAGRSGGSRRTRTARPSFTTTSTCRCLAAAASASTCLGLAGHAGHAGPAFWRARAHTTNRRVLRTWYATAIREPLSEEASQAALLERWKSKKASKMESRWSTALRCAPPGDATLPVVPGHVG